MLLDVDMAKCMERNWSRCAKRQEVPDSVISKMSLTLERPHTERNSWEQSSLILVNDDDDEVDDILDDIVETIANSIKNPIEPPPPVKDNSEDRAITSKNEIHNADKILRRIVWGRLLKGQTMGSKCQQNEEDRIGGSESRTTVRDDG